MSCPVVNSVCHLCCVEREVLMCPVCGCVVCDIEVDPFREIKHREQL